MKPKSLYRAALFEYLFYASLTADPAEARAAYRSYRQLAEKGCPDSWFGLGRARHYGYGVKANREKAEKSLPPRRQTRPRRSYRNHAGQPMTNLQKSPTNRRARNGMPRAFKQHGSTNPRLQPMQPTASAGYTSAASAAKKTLRQPACFTAKQPKRVAPKPNAPSVTATKKGLGLHKNYAKARKWSARAALQADATACNNLGFLYYNGKGVRRSKKLAKKWYKLAARAGSILALSNLGVLYEDAGRLKKTVRYYRRAAEAGNKYAAKQLKRLDK